VHVDLIATTTFAANAFSRAYGYNAWGQPGAFSSQDPDALAEAAGRLCYKSFDRPNPDTSANEDYLANILAQQHFSVLEHASASFLVRGVSRSLLAELTRHRHLSFSVVSQRYVDYSQTEPVIPPALKDAPEEVMNLRDVYAFTVSQYEVLYARLRRAGLPKKKAREAARAVLPNMAPVDLVVSGNMRAWRDVIAKRNSPGADAEIQELAGELLARLHMIAPATFQDFTKE
jgi:thymidylate synthase (FAD)